MQSAPQLMMWDANGMGMVSMGNPVNFMGTHVYGGQPVIAGDAMHMVPPQPQIISDNQGIVWIHPQQEDISYQLSGLVPGQIPCVNQQLVMVSAMSGQPQTQQIHPGQEFAHIRPQGTFFQGSESLPQRQIIHAQDGVQLISLNPEVQRSNIPRSTLNPNSENFPPNHQQVYDERPRLTPRRRNGFNPPTKCSDSLSWRKKSSEKMYQSVAVRRRSQSPVDIIELSESALTESSIPKPNKRIAPFLPPHIANAGPSPADVIEAYNTEIWRAPDHRNLHTLLEVIEYYFSDDCLAKNGYMLKQVSGKSDGFISVKKVASLKRIKQITRDIRTVVYSIRHSNKLELSEDGLMVRRKNPLPDNLEAPRFIRSILAINLPTENPSVEDVTSWFAEYGELTQVRILRPGKPLPSYLKDYTSWVPDLGCHYCAVVEFESQDEAQKACREINMKNRERFNLRVALLKPGARIRRTLYRKYKDSDEKEVNESEAHESSAVTRRNRCYSQSSDGSETNHSKENKSDCAVKKQELDYDASGSGSDTCSSSSSDYGRLRNEGLKPGNPAQKTGSHYDSGYSHSSSDERDIHNKKQNKSRSISPMISNQQRKSSLGEKKFVDGIPIGVIRQPIGPVDDCTKGFEYKVIDSV